MSRPALSHRPDFVRLFFAVGPVFGLVLVIGLFSLSPAVRSHFFTGINCKIILLQTVIVALGALGMTMIIVSGGIDLSVGSVVALTSVVGATSLVNGCPPAVAVVLTIAVAGGVGLINGLIIAGFRMMPFIVTLGMMGVARGTAKWLAGNQTVNTPKSSINNLMAMLDPLHFFLELIAHKADFLEQLFDQSMKATGADVFSCFVDFLGHFGDPVDCVIGEGKLDTFGFEQGLVLLDQRVFRLH